MNRLPCIALSSLLALSVTSCQTTDLETVTIDAVSPYSTLSDREIDAEFRIRMAELDSLNEKMKVANQERDFVAVNVAAKQGLDKARDARNLVRHLNDADQRGESLERISKLIERLEYVVEITGLT